MKSFVRIFIKKTHHRMDIWDYEILRFSSVGSNKDLDRISLGPTLGPSKCFFFPPENQPGLPIPWRKTRRPFLHILPDKCW